MTRRFESLRLLTLSVLLLCSGCDPGREPATSVSLGGNASRESRWMRGLSVENNPLITRRALQEIGSSTVVPLTAYARLLQWTEGTMFECQGLAAALSRGMEPYFGDFTNAFMQGPGYPSMFLCAIANMDQERQRLVPLIRAKIASADFTEADKLVAYATLACIGVDRQRNLVPVERCLSAGGNTRENVGLMQFIVLVKSKEWISEIVVSGLVRSIEKNNDVSMIAALAAGSLGDKGRAALPAIEQAVQNSRQPMVLFQCLKSKFNTPDNRVGRDFVRLFGDAERLEEPIFPLCEMVADAFLDEQDVSTVVSLLSDADCSVRLGAVRLVAGIGVRAQGAEKRLLELLNTDGDERMRVEVASAAGCACSEAVIPTLERFCNEQKNDFIREALLSSIALIRLERYP